MGALELEALQAKVVTRTGGTGVPMDRRADGQRGRWGGPRDRVGWRESEGGEGGWRAAAGGWLLAAGYALPCALQLSKKDRAFSAMVEKLSGEIEPIRREKSEQQERRGRHRALARLVDATYRLPLGLSILLPTSSHSSAPTAGTRGGAGGRGRSAPHAGWAVESYACK